jgi:hypothetical protein
MASCVAVVLMGNSAQIYIYLSKILILKNNVNLPNSIGLIFNVAGNFSIRGKFANTKLSGVGRVELENGEIYDGIFRNGVFMRGVFYNATNDSYLHGVFQNQLELFEKGRGFPYRALRSNKAE